MKFIKSFSLILLGLILHKGLEEVYDYKFKQGFDSKICREQYVKDANNRVDAPLTKRFRCTYKEMGLYSKLSYVLMRPHWSDDTSQRWYY